MTVKSATRSTIENNIFYRSMLAGNTAFSPEDEFLLEEVVLSSSQTSVTFDVSSYAGTYRNLQIRMVARSTTSGGASDLLIRLNADTASNYSWHQLFGDGSSVSSGAGTSTTAMRAGQCAAAGAGTNVFSAHVTDLLDVFDTNKYTTIRTLGGVEGASDYVHLVSGSWRNTNALTSITVLDAYGGNLAQYSRFSIYGEI